MDAPSPLHFLLTALVHLDNASAAEGDKLLGHLRTALDAGADPDAINHNGNTPLWTLVDELRVASNTQHVMAAIRALMEAGANPHVLCKQRGCQSTVLERLCANPGADLEGPNSMGGWAACQLMRDTGLQEERGLQHFHPRGDTPLHTCAARGPELLPFVLHRHKSLAIRTPWITARNKDGDTVLHALWKERRLLRDMRELSEMDASIDMVWQGTRALLEAGASLAATNNAGQTPLQWIRRQLRDGLKRHGDGWVAVERFLQAEQLEQRTPAVGTNRERRL